MSHIGKGSSIKAQIKGIEALSKYASVLNHFQLQLLADSPEEAQ